MQLLDKTVDMRGSQILNMRTYESVVWQRRCMACSALLAWISVIPLIVALSTCSWAVIDFVNTDFEQVNVQLGTWGEWRTKRNGSVEHVEWIPHFPTPPGHILRLANHDLKHFHRAQAVFGVISLTLLLCTNTLALYTFYHHRYMFKRLTAGLFLITGMCVLVTIEVVSKSVDEWRVEVAQAARFGDWDYDTVRSYGFSAYLAFSVIAACIFAAITFVFASHKQKGENAATADLEIEDRPMHVGR